MAAYSNEIDDESQCRHCKGRNMRVDWAQGDKICTDCGVVAEERLLDDRPEWKDFCEAEDLVKGLPSGARSGLVMVDETKYLGGLQPTTLSKQVFGNPMQTDTNGSGNSSANIRKSLNATNRKMDFYMEKEQKKALKRAKLSLLLKRKRISVDDNDHDEHVCPEHESMVLQEESMVLQEEQDAHRAHQALSQEKWSLERAILLHGDNDDNAAADNTTTTTTSAEELNSRLTKSLKSASSDLYTAHTILQQAAQQLQLPPRVIQNAIHRLCQYATQKDGLTVKGVASRLSSTSNTSTSKTNALRDYNQQKQMAALASALLFLEARNHGHQRSLQEVCASFHYSNDSNDNNDNGDNNNNNNNNSTQQPFVKAKHCNKAMKELRSLFPEYMRTVSAEAQQQYYETAGNFVEHATRKLDLPPVATASIQILIDRYSQQQQQESKQQQHHHQQNNLSTTCAAVTLLVCMAGTVMQRLARQAMGEPPAAKRLKRGGSDDNIQQQQQQQRGTPTMESVLLLDKEQQQPQKQKKNSTTTTFDLFLHPAVMDDPTYEMRQMWDAWAEQMPWSRSMLELEQAFKVTKPTVLEFFKTCIYPQRLQLLSLLQESHQTTPRAQVLMRQISTASALLNSQGKV